MEAQPKVLHCVLAAFLAAGVLAAPAARGEGKSGKGEPRRYSERVQLHQVDIKVPSPEQQRPEEAAVPEAPQQDLDREMDFRGNKTFRLPADQPRPRPLVSPRKPKRNWLTLPPPEALNELEERVQTGWGEFVDEVLEDELKSRTEVGAKEEEPLSFSPVMVGPEGKTEEDAGLLIEPVQSLLPEGLLQERHVPDIMSMVVREEDVPERSVEAPAPPRVGEPDPDNLDAIRQMAMEPPIRPGVLREEPVAATTDPGLPLTQNILAEIMAPLRKQRSLFLTTDAARMGDPPSETPQAPTGRFRPLPNLMQFEATPIEEITAAFAPEPESGIGLGAGTPAESVESTTLDGVIQPFEPLGPQEATQPLPGPWE